MPLLVRHMSFVEHHKSYLELSTRMTLSQERRMSFEEHHKSYLELSTRMTLQVRRMSFEVHHRSYLELSTTAHGQEPRVPHMNCSLECCSSAFAVCRRIGLVQSKMTMRAQKMILMMSQCCILLRIELVRNIVS